MKNVIKISITTLGSLAILGTSVLAAAGTINAPSGLVLREEASKTANPLTTVPDKAEVDILEKNGEWYKVNYNSQEGYLFAEYVTAAEEVTNQEPETPEISETQEQPTTENPNSVQAANRLKVYNMPLITSTVVSEIDTNVQITVIKEITNWSYISAGEIQGWVRTYGIQNPVQPEIPAGTSEEPKNEPEENTELTNEPTEPTVSEPETTTPEETDEETTTSYNPSNSAQTENPSSATKGYVAVNSATVRKEATTESEVVTYLIKGTSFDIKAETEEWYKIEYEDIEGKVYQGYIYKSLVTI